MILKFKFIKSTNDLPFLGVDCCVNAVHKGRPICVHIDRLMELESCL